MINKKRTLLEFKYTSDTLSAQTHKKVWRICNICGAEAKVRYKYRNNLCRECFSKQVRGPFNIEYFQAISESISNRYIDELKTFEEFEYYSIDLSSKSHRYVYTICYSCGNTRKSKHHQITPMCKKCVGKSKVCRNDRSKRQSGKNNYMYGRTGARSANYNKKRSDESRQKQSVSILGELNHNWKGGITHDSYSKQFNNLLKQRIRINNSNCDFLIGIHKDICDPKRELSVHHIDYDKLNTNINNLIPLSNTTHINTNYNRDFWESLFNAMLYIDDDIPELNVLLNIRTNEI